MLISEAAYLESIWALIRTRGIEFDNKWPKKCKYSNNKKHGAAQ